MILNKTQPLEIAARILTAEHLALFRHQPFNLYGWTILDRWAMNEPAALKALQEEGTVVIYDRLMQQQELEQGVLLENSAMLQGGLTPTEVLLSKGVPLNLK